MKFINVETQLPEPYCSVLALLKDRNFLVLYRISDSDKWREKNGHSDHDDIHKTSEIEKWAYLYPLEEEDDGWISVNESLPQPGVDVLVCLDNGERDTDCMSENGKWNYYANNPICWQPLPGKPKNLKKLALQKKYKDLRDDLEALKEMISKEDI